MWLIPALIAGAAVIVIALFGFGFLDDNTEPSGCAGSYCDAGPNHGRPDNHNPGTHNNGSSEHHYHVDHNSGAFVD